MATPGVNPRIRKRLDVEGEDEVSASGRKKLKLDTKLRDDCLLLVITWMVALMGPHIDIAVQLMTCNLIYNTFQVVRQEKNGNAGAKPAKFKEEEISVGPAKFRTKEIRKMIRDAWKTDDDWLGTMSSIVCLTCWFPKRLASTRIMPSELLLRKSAQGDDFINLKDFGILPELRHLCDGILLPPGMRSNMAQSLGPLTITIMLARAKPGKYSAKWKEAFIRVFNNVPGVEQIATFLENATKMSTCVPIITMLGKIAIVTGTREQHRVCFLPKYLIIWAQNKNLLGDISFSGPNALAHLSTMFKNLDQFVEIRAPVEETQKVCELLFHACAGTQFEDLGILSHITSLGNWHTRPQVDKALKYLTTSNSYVNKLVLNIGFYLRYVSKVSGASMTSFSSGASGPISTTMVFAGFRTRLMTDKMTEFLKKGAMGTAGDYGTTAEVVAALENFLGSLLKIIGDQPSFQAGTVSWKEVESSDEDVFWAAVPDNQGGIINQTKSLPVDTVGDETNLYFAESGKSFWSSD